MKTSQTTLKAAAAVAGMALFPGAAAAAGIDRGKELTSNGAVISAPDVVSAAGRADAQ